MAAAEQRSTFTPIGLRARISLAFAIGGLVLSVVLAGVTMVLSREQLISTRDHVGLVLFLRHLRVPSAQRQEERLAVLGGY